ncbi:glycoside hydrolase family 5 protein [Streptomyces sp. NPDC020379]|uniref:glycoside hydrolase family 5 protein n=1 Tax=Streptomyces sp. NPDC020379 TaxID=3365071 RepID=UPI0037B48052
MRRLRATVTALAAVLGLLVPGSAGARTPDADAVPRLTDERGRVLDLRGWNVEDKTHRGADALTGITERHFRDMAAAGFGLARLLVFWDDLEPRPGQYSERCLRRIERILDWAHRYRVRVVIDAHQDVFGPAFGGHRGIPEWATRTDGLPYVPHPGDWFSEYYEPAVQAAFEHLYEDADLRLAQARMWQLLAGRFGRHPAVFGYDLINEPMGKPRSGEDPPTAARRIERDQLTPMYNRLAAAVRRADRRHHLFVEPTPAVGEAVPTGLGRVHDPKVVYAPHFYNTAMESGQDYDPSAHWIEAYESAVTRYPREQHVPVVIGEWGPLNSALPNMPRFYDDALASLSRYASGWAAYVWCYGGGYCAVDGAGRFPASKGRLVRPYAEAVAGRVSGESYGAGGYRLVYEGVGAGVSVVSLPGASWRWRVSVAGASADRVGRRLFVRAWGGGRVVVTVRGA